MLIDINTALTTLDGQKMFEARRDKDGNDIREAVTLRNICIGALLAETKNPVAGEIKFKRYQLATKIQSSEREINLSSDEIVMLKELIGQNFITLVVGRAYDLLEGGAAITNKSVAA